MESYFRIYVPKIRIFSERECPFTPGTATSNIGEPRRFISFIATSRISSHPICSNRIHMANNCSPRSVKYDYAYVEVRARADKATAYCLNTWHREKKRERKKGEGNRQREKERKRGSGEFLFFFLFFFGRNDDRVMNGSIESRTVLGAIMRAPF